jgi:hypothetical protein
MQTCTRTSYSPSPSFGRPLVFSLLTFLPGFGWHPSTPITNRSPIGRNGYTPQRNVFCLVFDTFLLLPSQRADCCLPSRHLGSISFRGSINLTWTRVEREETDDGSGIPKGRGSVEPQAISLVMEEFGFRNYSIVLVSTDDSCRSSEGVKPDPATDSLHSSMREVHVLPHPPSFLSSLAHACVISRTQITLQSIHVWGLVQKLWREDGPGDLPRYARSPTSWFLHRSCRNASERGGMRVYNGRGLMRSLHPHSFLCSL